ncbi:hypothetical protein LCGC14_2104000 [marine sediment metagenome]|uniref:Uncharacterized protein n=1 Tax=marine sediment metagenome TaxID=412755 RepID=A0A0F9E976_9ZZZZ
MKTNFKELTQVDELMKRWHPDCMMQYVIQSSSFEKEDTKLFIVRKKSWIKNLDSIIIVPLTY